MSAKLIHRVPFLALALLAGTARIASAQFYDPSCACVQPVATTCYQTVPVTEYRQVKQKVMRPVVEQKYVEEPVTEYRPVTEQRTAEVPTVSYQNVTEYRTVQRDAGGWVTNYQPVAKMSPCQYDGSPTFGGWLNRTAYSVRSAFTPNYYVSRQYVPRIVSQTVPVTRQVAVRGTQQVTYNVTRYEAHKTTRRVAVNTVKYVESEETVSQPVTVYRTVPTGTSMVYGVSPYGFPTTTVFAPSATTVLAPTPDANFRSAENTDKYSRDRSTDDAAKRDTGKADAIKRMNHNDSSPFPEGARVQPGNGTTLSAHRASNPPSIVRVSSWRPTGTTSPQPGPALIAPAIASK